MVYVACLRIKCSPTGYIPCLEKTETCMVAANFREKLYDDFFNGQSFVTTILVNQN